MFIISILIHFIWSFKKFIDFGDIITIYQIKS